ncbi:MAG TPA: phosphomannomutase/phosphoglucomutase, partial [Gaiellaceae bacterium]|nr:phosphomannomutase/phosphoglucomutase [Gaiellaceae bacterium]
MLDPGVFKAYDVRGLYGSELDEEGAYAIARAYVDQFGPSRIAIGHDMRVSSPSMAAAAREGAADGGAEVLDLGLIGTEMLYFAVGELGLDGGLTVTASHNPKDYTGMKIVRAGALPVGGESGLLDVRDRALAADWRDATRGAIREEDIWARFVDRVLSFVDVSAIRPLRVVIDAANGMAGAMLPPVLERLPMLDVVRCYFEPDGTFPNHEPNPLLPENRTFIVERTRAEGADFGVAFDGDADRCFFVDDAGEFVPGDFTTALFAQQILAREPGGKVIYDVRASWAVPEAIRAAGGEPLVNRVGHAFIKQRMREEHAVFGGEVSAHYYFRDFSQADSGTVPFLLMCELVSQRGRLSRVLEPFRSRYFITGEINTPVADVPAKLRELEERYAPLGRVSHLDGLSVEADDWHFNVRPSNTEP